MISEKFCPVCRETKLLCDFPANRQRKAGVSSRCKVCHNALSKKHYDPERHANYYNRTRADRRVSAIRQYARSKGIAYDLDGYREQIRERFAAGKCEMTGISFVIQSGRHWAAPSIDRIKPSEGYVYSNIRIVLDIMNLAMNAYGEGVLRDVMAQWLKDR